MDDRTRLNTITPNENNCYLHRVLIVNAIKENVSQSPPFIERSD